jgi:hypothetical protein
MSRIVIPSARVASAARRLVLPVGMKGRASIRFDGTDDRVVGAAPGISGSAAWTMAVRVRPVRTTATTPMALFFGSSAGGKQGAYLGGVRVTGIDYVGGGLFGGATAYSTAHPISANQRWMRLVLTYPGGAAQKLTAYLDGEFLVQSSADTPAIVDTATILGAGTAAGGYCWPGNTSDARIYSRAWTNVEVAADARGEWVDPTGLVRWWTCENPGYGTTCHEEIGNTEDTMTGAVWSPDVPFRRRRVVEDVAAAFAGDGNKYITITHAAGIDPGAGSFGVGMWMRIVPTAQTVARKYDGTNGWLLARHANGRLYCALVSGGSGINLGLTDGPIFNDYRWHRVWLVRDVSIPRFFLFADAAAPATLADSLGSIGTTAHMYVGSSAGVSLTGAANDLTVVIGRAPTWAELDADCYDGVLPAGAILWSLREGSGTSAVSVPAGYNGTLSAAGWTTATRCKARTAA